MFNKICCEPELCYWGELPWDTSDHPAGALLTTHTLGAHLQSPAFSRSRVISIQQKQQQGFRFTPWSRWRNETIFPLATASTPDKPWLNYVITFVMCLVKTVVHYCVFLINSLQLYRRKIDFLWSGSLLYSRMESSPNRGARSLPLIYLLEIPQLEKSSFII